MLFFNSYTNCSWKNRGKISVCINFFLFLLGYKSRCRTDVNPGKPIRVKGNTGSLVSPGYPNSYPITSCTWRIVVPNGHIVEMNIKDFEMNCAGGSELQVGKDHFCGSKKPSDLLTSEVDMEIKMISKLAQNNRGFYATFSMTKKGS